MHSQGNDFLVLDNRQKKYLITKKKIIELSNRNKGVGFDQFIQLENSNSADMFMRIFNADGSEAEMCGNAARCVASLIFASKPKTKVLIETLSSIINSSLEKNGDISIELDKPKEKPRFITLNKILKNNKYNNELLQEKGIIINMGNPHIVFFCNNVNSFKIEEVGPLVEKNSFFKDGTNVEFIEIKSPESISVKVWERGTGLTQACGSGALASFYAAYISKLCGEKISINLPGGIVKVLLTKNNTLQITGSVTVSFLGEFNL